MGEILSTNEKIRRLQYQVEELKRMHEQLAEQFDVLTCQFNGMANAVLGRVGMNPETIQELLDNSREIAQDVIHAVKDTIEDDDGDTTPHIDDFRTEDSNPGDGQRSYHDPDGMNDSSTPEETTVDIECGTCGADPEYVDQCSTCDGKGVVIVPVKSNERQL